LVSAGQAAFVVAVFWFTWRKGNSLSAKALLAMLPAVVGCLPQIMYSLNWIERSWLTEYAFVVGIVLESILMLYVLQQHSRTLAHADQRMSERARFDALTGLLPRTAGFLAVNELMGRAQDQGAPIALALVVLENAAEIDREHGHEAMDNALLVAARQIIQHSTRGDVLARLGRASFLLAPALDADTAQLRNTAAGVIASGLRGHRVLPPGVSLQFRVWISREHCKATSVLELITELERAASDAPAFSDTPMAKRIDVIRDVASVPQSEPRWHKVIS
jgi:GGDEF domain-containing protein